MSRTALATLKSCAFLALFVTIYQYQICMHRKVVGTGITSFNSKYLYGLFGFVCSASSIFLEEKKRRGELAMYCLPIALKSFYQIAYQRKWIVRIKHFEVMMTSVAMAIIMVSLSLSKMENVKWKEFANNAPSHFIKKNPISFHPLFAKSCSRSLAATNNSYVPYIWSPTCSNTTTTMKYKKHTYMVMDAYHRYDFWNDAEYILSGMRMFV